jgi:serine O-acetyltransferase
MEKVNKWVRKVFLICYPVSNDLTFSNETSFDGFLDELEGELLEILSCSLNVLDYDVNRIVRAFFDELPKINTILDTEVKAICEGDPAARSVEEVVRCYPGIRAIAAYRFAHFLYGKNVPIIPRMITECAHGSTGIDIHPGAQIGDHFFIDHGTGVVIGETAKIGTNVKIYQGVTLGGLSVRKIDAYEKRHPTIEDNVVIYASATILGGETVIGNNTVIGGNVWLTESVPSYSLVFAQHETKIRDKKEYVQAIDFVI